jgi:formyltetrahydrofolate deformylase
MNPKLTAILLLSCPDRLGLVSRISHFIFERGGNIINLREHVDDETGIFFIRIAWTTENFTIPVDELNEAFAPLAKEFKADCTIHFAERKHKAAIFISKYEHCIQDLLWRYSIGEFNFEIPLIISNHEKLKNLVEQYNIPFYYFPITAENKAEQEKKEIELMKKHKIDFVVLARYMQILSPQLIKNFPNRIINIHHSFLPAFIGSDPYKQAYDRGVKIIGTTSHYVTEELDEGPIIEQDIIRISHKDTVTDLKRKGRDLERLVLARAIHLHSKHQVLVYGKKTVIFD